MQENIIRVNNNELLINESHTNKYIFFLHRIPTSFAFSKFLQNCVSKDCQPPGYYEEIFKEQNNDTKNLALYVQSVDMPSLDLKSISCIDFKFFIAVLTF
jgi:hypothetical protein